MFPFHSVNKKGTIARNGLKYPGSILTKVRSSKRKCSMIKADLKNFAIFTIFAGLQACIFIKKRLQHRCFPVNIENTYSANGCFYYFTKFINYYFEKNRISPTRVFCMNLFLWYLLHSLCTIVDFNNFAPYTTGNVRKLTGISPLNSNR